MLKKIWQYTYYYLITPAFLILIHLIALYNSKYRKGILTRYNIQSKLNSWSAKTQLDGKRVLIHAASLGEFEHIKPLLNELKQKFKTINIVTFFSPSGFENAGEVKELDYFSYMPFDTPHSWKKFYKVVKPDLIILAKHDVWPAYIWTAQKQGIPIYLINASLSQNSSRIKVGIRSFLKYVYRDIDKICAISKEDSKRFKKYYPECRIEVMGDTKYDQVLIRKKNAQKIKLFVPEWTMNKWFFVAGSIWPEDEKHLFPALFKIIEKYVNFNLILVPHQPNSENISYISSFFERWGVISFSERKQLKNQRVMVVDVVGYLAGIYNYAHSAYVGGSFRQGVHNVMEPAIFSIPVLYGPTHKNSYEAIKLAETEGGIVVNNSKDIQHCLEGLLNNEKERIRLGKQAEKFTLQNMGATKKLISEWKYLLKERD